MPQLLNKPLICKEMYKWTSKSRPVVHISQRGCVKLALLVSNLGEEGPAECRRAPAVAAKEKAQVEDPLGPGEADKDLVDDDRGGAEGHYCRVLPINIFPVRSRPDNVYRVTVLV